MGRGLKRDSEKLVGGKVRVLTGSGGILKTAPMCSLFQRGFDGKWSAAKAGRCAAT